MGVGESVPESTVAYDRFRLDGTYYSDDGDEPAPVWASSQHLRELVEKQDPQPSATDRRLLGTETQRQLRTLGLYREVARLLIARTDAKNPGTLSLYVLLFPGEARDNTGIKDLNDKVLGYKLSSEFVVARQDEIRAIFPPPGGATGPRFSTVGQDYKTAYIVAVGRTPLEFAKELIRLDARLRDRLMAILKKAQQQTKDSKRLAEIKKLHRTLEKNKKYRFDYLFGVNALPVAGKAMDLVFQLVTEALKGAGIARYAAKGQTVKSEAARKFGRDKAFGSPPKGQDPRGRDYRSDVYLRMSTAAEDIKLFMTKAPAGTGISSYDYFNIYVDTVWTKAFLLHRRMFTGNPDVIRDVRKKALVRPPIRAGTKYSFPAQRELLELWLVGLNLIDFVKDFVSAEHTRELQRHHVLALLALEELEAAANPAVDWKRLTPILTRDLRQGPDPLPVLGAASEFQFYSYSSDYPDQIFFTMDVRDLGVDLMTYYEVANKETLDGALAGLPLMAETFRSTDPTVDRKRHTYDSVVAVFRKYHGQLANTAAKAAADKAFGGAVSAGAPLPGFARSVQVMLGGDEVFVAAHPHYAAHVHDIICELTRTSFAGRPLNMRTAVVYSSANRARGASGPGYGPTISDGQRRENQAAHDRAMKLAGDGPDILKPLERAQRRIERLIDKLEANAKKKHLAPPYAKRLADLHLLELFARAKYQHPQQLSDLVYRRLRRLLRAGDLAGAYGTGLFDLVDCSGTRVDLDALHRQLKDLEDAVRQDVGVDNIHTDPIPVIKMPKWIEELIDLLDPKEKLA